MTKMTLVCSWHSINEQWLQNQAHLHQRLCINQMEAPLTIAQHYLLQSCIIYITCIITSYHKVLTVCDYCAHDLLFHRFQHQMCPHFQHSEY